MYLSLAGEKEDLNVVDAGEGGVAEELNGDPVERDEASRDTVSELDDVSKFERVM